MDYAFSLSVVVDGVFNELDAFGFAALVNLYSYNIYAPLLAGCTSILYDGTPDYPRPDMWWEFIERNKVTGIFSSPTGIRALMRLGTEQAGKHKISSVERVVCAGEVLNPAAWEWLQKKVFEDRIPVLSQ